MNTSPAERPPVSKSADGKFSLMVFDDGSSFEDLIDLNFSNVQFAKCRTFADIDAYLSDVRAGTLPPPIMLAIDIYCDIHADFGMFGVLDELDPNKCGYQLYELVLRSSGPSFEKVPVLFFTSFPSGISDAASARLSKKYSVTIKNCARQEFRDHLLDMMVECKVISSDDARSFRTEDLTQEEYEALFRVVASEMRLSTLEICKFFGLSSDRAADVTAVIRMSTLANERIDLLLAISVLLDGLLNRYGKREFLENYSQEDGRNAMDLLVTGGVRGLLQLKHEIEFRIGGGIL